MFFQILSLIKGREGTQLKMEFRRDGKDFEVELVRRAVSQVGVVNTGEQLPGSVLFFPPHNLLCVTLQTLLNNALVQGPKNPKVPRCQHDDLIVRVLAHSPIRASTCLVRWIDLPKECKQMKCGGNGRHGGFRFRVGSPKRTTRDVLEDLLHECLRDIGCEKQDLTFGRNKISLVLYLLHITRQSVMTH